MNDFKKEELDDLLFCVKDHVGYQEDSIHENLINKIQAMIDNYCVHDCKAVIWQCQVTACSKCGYPSTLVKVNK